MGEIIAANRGLGYLLSDAASQFDTAAVFAALVGIIALALILNTAVKLAERRLMPWKTNDAERNATVLGSHRQNLYEELSTDGLVQNFDGRPLSRPLCRIAT